ncbi:MAG: malto-oligosyltrehalose trehalohydrolase [Aquabacterium sp.]
MQAEGTQRHAHGACGAHVRPEGTFFRVWSSVARRIDVVIEAAAPSSPSTPTAPPPATLIQLEPEGDGHFSGLAEGIGHGSLYRFRIDGDKAHAAPCSRFQPQGPHGPSMVVDPSTFQWTDAAWQGAPLHGQVIYELHIGTFTPQGTYEAALHQLEALRDLGVTVLEIMPLAECPGRWNWGYDGVNLYAPYHVYGEPDALRRFVDRAHQLGLAVILDVVYNHLGPDGNALTCFSPDYFTDRYPNEWGQAINFDGQHSRHVREYFIRNACYWIDEFHFDGLRLDATQCIHDASPTHVLAELSRRVREAAHPRTVLLIAENEPQDVRTVMPIEAGGHGLDAAWNDDFHHAARVALTGRHEGYLHDHRGRAQELLSAIRHGFLFQGQYYSWQKQPRGTPSLTLGAPHLVHFIQNHDQVANTFWGQRLHELTSPGRLRAMTALMLLGPQTPMLFMGQEFAASTPFTFFADHQPELASKVWQGRREFVAQFPAWAGDAAQARILDPSDEATFTQCKLDWSERERHAEILALHQSLIALRRTDPVLSQQRREAIDGAVLSDKAFVLRWFAPEHGDRLLLVNLGDELDFRPVPEPLLAPPAGHRWHLQWSSDHPAHGGAGLIDPCEADGWRLPGESACLMTAVCRGDDATASTR